MNRLLILVVLVVQVVGARLTVAGESGDTRGDIAVAAQAINTLGLELLRAGIDSGRNAVLSPYSIQLALGMVYAGSDGLTRSEMGAALHYPDDEPLLHSSFGALTKAIEAQAKGVVAKPTQGTSPPFSLAIANRLYGQVGFPIRRTFLSTLSERYRAPFVQVDFVRKAEIVAGQINAWVSDTTRQRIPQAIDPGALDRLTRLVLVNAVYLKAPWMNAFKKPYTTPQPFEVAGQPINVPTMKGKAHFGYGKHEGFTVVTLPYSAPDLQFLIVLPDKGQDLRDLESRMTSARLVELGKSPAAWLILHVPKVELGPDELDLNGPLTALGMQSAFDSGKADFRRMSSTRGLYVSKAMHKAFLTIDEEGTEAAAATVVIMDVVSKTIEPRPREVRIDRPFLFAVQHRPSGACLFLGRVVDPR